MGEKGGSQVMQYEEGLHSHLEEAEVDEWVKQKQHFQPADNCQTKSPLWVGCDVTFTFNHNHEVFCEPNQTVTIPLIFKMVIYVILRVTVNQLNRLLRYEEMNAIFILSSSLFLTFLYFWLCEKSFEGQTCLQVLKIHFITFSFHFIYPVISLSCLVAFFSHDSA